MNPSSENEIGPQRLAQANAAREAFLRALQSPDDSQRNVLLRALHTNASTEIGEKYNFASITDALEFKRRTPIVRYNDMASQIDACAKGAPAYFTSDQPILFFESSGTTTGVSKQVPVTATYFQQCYLPAYFASLGNLARFCPDAIRFDDRALNLKFDPGATRHRVQTGAEHVGISQVNFQSMGHPLAVEPGTQAPWTDVDATVENPHTRAYLRLRTAAVTDDLNLVIGINPALVAALRFDVSAYANVWWKHSKRNRRRPSLSVFARRRTQIDCVRWRRSMASCCHNIFGPESAMFSLGTVVRQSRMCRVSQTCLARTRLLAAPLGASESIVAVPIDTHPTSCALAINAAFFEFADAETPLDSTTDTLGFRDLVEGRRYHVITTNIGGFYRYALGDVIQVDGSAGTACRV
ncbi:MAG: GH3 auxin-responsive promoter family protein [Polyangiales bacterium]